jgi:CarD family transcriptional regulator
MAPAAAFAQGISGVKRSSCPHGHQESSQRSGFKTSGSIVIRRGVGKITGIDTQEVAGLKLDLFVISFVKDKMTLRVPVTKATAVGMRKLADALTVKRSLETVRGRARIKRTMWSRRAQEYEAKINSGDLIAIAEVVRDLFRSENQPEQSYSERQLYEAALDRMSREISSVNKISETEAIRQIEQNLAKSPRRGAPREGESKDAKAA